MISEDKRKALVEDIQQNPAYRLAYEDLLQDDDLRPLRLQLELIKPERALRKHAIHSTVVVFGSARIISPDMAQKQLADAQSLNPNMPERERALIEADRQIRLSHYYSEARRFAKLVSCQFQQ